MDTIKDCRIYLIYNCTRIVVLVPIQTSLLEQTVFSTFLYSLRHLSWLIRSTFNPSLFIQSPIQVLSSLSTHILSYGGAAFPCSSSLSSLRSCRMFTGNNRVTWLDSSRQSRRRCNRSLATIPETWQKFCFPTTNRRNSGSS